MRLYLVRHGQPEVAAGVCYGRTDLAVSAREQDRVLSNLARQVPAALLASAPIFSSPLQRCASLAQALSAQWGCGPVQLDARLAELDFGRWEMQAWDAIDRGEIDAWSADLVDYQPGGGESVLQMAARVQAFSLALKAQQLPSAIVIAHAGTMRLLSAARRAADLREMALKAARTPHAIAYGGVLGYCKDSCVTE
ncbi:MAG: histidine phosphatase family protein [Pseudomonadota bacterium]